MAKEISVYDICTIGRHNAQQDLLIERFGSYLQKHYPNLHRPHRHSFYHLVLFTKGTGSYTIDLEKFPVAPYQIYFMIPGQVHSWHFKSNVDSFIVHFRTIKLPKEYAQLLYVTPNHLNALCQDLSGKTAGDLIRDRILLEAKRLLTNAAMTITEIVYKLHFGDHSFFNRFLKKK